MAQKKTEHIGSSRWILDPRLFVREAIGATPTNQQDDALEALGRLCAAKIKAAKGLPMSDAEAELSQKIGISIRSGHGTGKDAWLAWVYLWLLTCFPFPKGLVTGPTGHQLDDILWPEIRKWLRVSRAELSNYVGIHADRVFNIEAKDEWFVAKRTAVVKGSEEEQGETLAGMHSDYMVLAVDEASGVPRGVFKPFEGAQTGMFNIGILIGNPTRSTGYFHDTHKVDKHRWITFRWSCEDSNIDEITGNNAMALYVERTRQKYGSDSNFFRIRVSGEFPSSDPDALIPIDWIYDAVGREVVVLEGASPVLGVDVARFGDAKSVICTRYGQKVMPLRRFSKIDTMELSGWIGLAVAEEEPAAVAIDVIGVGAGVVDRCRELGLRVFGVNVSESPSREDRFHRLRDELYWRLRERFEKRVISIPDDEDLIGELAAIKLKPQSDKVKVESKAEMRKRGEASPDSADSLMLTEYFPDKLVAHIGKTRDAWAKAFEEEELKKDQTTWMVN